MNKGTILIVDDTPENVQVLSATLTERGYQVRGIIKGKMAIRVAKNAMPDLILLDIRMPEMNGYEVCEQLKTDELTANIPIIFISALDETLDKVKAFQVGGVDYITKPFQVEEVLARVEHQLTIRRLSQALIKKNEELELEIIERKKAEEAAYAASQAKSEFLANMSHELRTPLNAIIGFTQLIMRDFNIDFDQLQLMKIIYRSGEHLLELINDILDLSKIEASAVELEVKSFDLYRLLDGLEELFQYKAERRNLKLQFMVSSDVPQYIKTDEKKLRICLINLIGNAIKFTENGNVILRVSKRKNKIENSPNFHELTFAVEDTGYGIDQLEMKKLFSAFVQTESGRKSGQGTGLGLTITQKYIQLMGGNINVESQIGVGTTFTFNIQLLLAHGEEVSPEKFYKVIGLESVPTEYKILVTDDTSENRLLLIKILAPLGFELKEADNGQEAVNIWESWQPNLIWMDTRMPIMDGLDATKEIRRQEKEMNKNNPTIIIALTASVFEEKKGEIMAAGCNDFIHKPFPQTIIFTKMAEYLKLRYIYEEISNLEFSGSDRHYSLLETFDTISLSKITEMPQNWIEKLYHAANEVNEDLVAELINQVSASYPDLFILLKDLLNDYRLDIIVKITKSVLKQV